jgi:hypothetical protein
MCGPRSTHSRLHAQFAAGMDTVTPLFLPGDDSPRGKSPRFPAVALRAAGCPEIEGAQPSPLSLGQLGHRYTVSLSETDANPNNSSTFAI